MLQSMELQRVGHKRVTELNFIMRKHMLWTELCDTHCPNVYVEVLTSNSIVFADVPLGVNSTS